MITEEFIKDLADIANAQRNDGWSEDEIARYKKMQIAIHTAAFPTEESTITFAEMDKIIRKAVGEVYCD